MTRPDPVDALKYALTIVANRLDARDGLEDVIDAVEAVAAPFLAGVPVARLRYSNGMPVTVTSEYAPGRALMNHYLPPWYPPTRSVRRDGGGGGTVEAARMRLLAPFFDRCEEAGYGQVERVDGRFAPLRGLPGCEDAAADYLAALIDDGAGPDENGA